VSEDKRGWVVGKKGADDEEYEVWVNDEAKEGDSDEQ